MSTFEACHRFVTTRAFHGVLNKAYTSTTVNAPIFSEVEVPLSTEMFSFCSGVCSGHRHLHLWPLTFPLHSNRAWDLKTDALSFSLSCSPFPVAFQAQTPEPLIPHLLPLTFPSGVSWTSSSDHKEFHLWVCGALLWGTYGASCIINDDPATHVFY